MRTIFAGRVQSPGSGRRFRGRRGCRKLRSADVGSYESASSAWPRPSQISKTPAKNSLLSLSDGFTSSASSAIVPRMVQDEHGRRSSVVVGDGASGGVWRPEAARHYPQDHGLCGMPQAEGKSFTIWLALRLDDQIRCHMDGGNPPCARCKKRGLPCSVNKSLQMILENDLSWKENIEQKILGFEAVISRIADRISCPELLDLMQVSQAGVDDGVVREDHPVPATHAVEEQPQQTWTVVNDPSSGPAVIPSTVVSEISPSITANHGPVKDPVSRGLLPLSMAEACFTAYKDRLDHFVYRVLDSHTSLSSVRRASPLLTAAVCAVGALHSSPEHYPACYRELVNLASAQLFSKRHTLDDIRALIIGAFWLHDISWTLIGAGKCTVLQAGAV